MQRIYLLSTGGTLEKVYSEQTGAVANRDSKIDRYLRMLRLPDAEVHTIQMLNKDSLEMTEADRLGILEKVQSLLPECMPIVVTHGTDTMITTGLFLKQHLPDVPVPIIFTGAMTPLGFEGSDGLQNLTESLFAARLLTPGIYLVMHGQVFPIDRVRKDRELARFVSK
jgi:L-asparaginase